MYACENACEDGCQGVQYENDAGEKHATPCPKRFHRIAASLLARGADPFLRDASGETALTKAAASAEMRDIMKFFLP
jgi:ankyrin repeat protein